MKARLNRSIVRLQALFVLIGLSFAASTVMYLVAHHHEMGEYFSGFLHSPWNALGALTPIFTGAMAVIYLVPMFIGFVLSKVSAQMFEFLAFMSRVFMYFPLAPGIILLAVYLACALVFNTELLQPASANLEDICAYIFIILLYLSATLMLFAYKIAGKLR